MESLKCKFNIRFISSLNSSFFQYHNSYGGAFVECTVSHPTEVEIVQLVFRINEVSFLVFQ